MWRKHVAKKLNGFVCDICGTFFKPTEQGKELQEPITGQGKNRQLHFCSLKCKSKWLKK